MERELDRRDGFGITGPDSTGQRIVDAVQLVDLNVGDVSGGRCGKFLGNGGLQPENVVDVLAGQRQHHVAAMWLQPDHPLTAQFQQRLPHRRDADSELGCRLVQTDERSRAQGARHDGGPQVARDLVGQLCPAQGKLAPRLRR
ncbi:Uncharacterised protein [Mycobacterium tuberculosis]|nr:Uncharacterised protein [Mycobacterium tuberculosis]COY46624.1 Uncharacterised protein [Mycobacterium tuberculosis]